MLDICLPLTPLTLFPTIWHLLNGVRVYIVYSIETFELLSNWVKRSLYSDIFSTSLFTFSALSTFSTGNIFSSYSLLTLSHTWYISFSSPLCLSHSSYLLPLALPLSPSLSLPLLSPSLFSLCLFPLSPTIFISLTFLSVLLSSLSPHLFQIPPCQIPK